MSKQNQLVILAAILALAVGIGLSFWLKKPGPAQPGASEALLVTPIKTLDGQTLSLAKYQGKILVVNFWATWCPPCRDEIPLFIESQRELAANGVQFVGIALDNPQKVADFAQEVGINYPVLLGGINESESLRKLGNSGGGLPYTLIYDRGGNLREKVLGSLEKARLEQLLAPLI